MLPPRDPLVVERDNCRRAIGQTLSLAEDRSFLTMIWAADALQHGRSEAALRYLKAVPAAAITDDLTDPNAVRGWELETLVNELLTTPKHPCFRLFDARPWQSVAELVNQLRRVEGAEYAARRGGVPILREMYRIGGRQFEWQRGFFNIPQFYRYTFIYGQGDCAEYVSERHGVTIADMGVMGFALLAAFAGDPVYDRRGDLALIGVAPEVRERVLTRLAAPLADVRELAGALRAGDADTPYRPSVLRRFPVIAAGHQRRQLHAPLPELIAARVTSGLFYDLIDGGGALRADYGRRFETYARRYLNAVLPALRIMPEWRYGTRRRHWDTPDLLGPVEDGETIQIVIECKATRMSFPARFGDAAVEEPGYEDMARAVVQVWRFFAHCRLGLTGRDLAADAVALVLTLDDWLVMGLPLREDVMARAEALSREREPEIEEQDRRSVAFVSMDDLERTLARATPRSFREAVRAAGQEQSGWLLSEVHRTRIDPEVERRDFPFAADVGALLPWWERIGDMVDEAPE